ncbi:hypothetical protein [Terriglobus saanensis]|uniref:Uncharacterized protein n=1 Tax=Terriglobus saanensis (strain ATCC BAA-1853 / DSM 23119 / SP1PR4) TaxID=401053 RepID=E8V309_TERSS|nr:hypothetical protein [Terriglobus saanensis]ADV81284.1 hypothetical protein AciPR4_0449 [Terriglobus saanensis SP1PR4]
MNHSTNHFSEDDLIAFHLNESKDEAAIRQHLDTCGTCGELSDSIAETLRVFSAEPVPTPDFETSWQRVRGNLTVLAKPQKKSWWKIAAWPALGTLTAVLLLTIAFVVSHQKQKTNTYAFNRPGPLTTAPADERNHLDAAERLLTTVNHTSGELDDTTRTQARTLALRNAVYVQQATQRGDLVEASTLESLGRVLTSLDNESHKSSTFRLRVEMNTDGLLLDIRILRQNDQK